MEPHPEPRANAADGARIRLATLGDVDELVRMRWDVSAEHGREATETPDAFRSRFGTELRDHLNAKRWSIWVAEAELQPGRLIGTASLERVDKLPRPYPRAATWGYVTNVYVDPGWRGAGLGARLMETIIASGREEGLGMLLLWPSPRALSLYERLGFVPSPGALELSLDPSE